MKLLRAVSIAAWAAPLFAQYAGPAVLTRGEAPAGMQDVSFRFRPFFTLGSVYDTGLSGVGVNSQGQLANLGSIGVSLNAGVSGSHSWKHTNLGISYRAGFYHYAKTTYYDGSDHNLMLSLTRQLTRHTSVSVRQSVGMYSRGYGMLGMPATIAFDPSTTYVPTTDFYDNRTLFLSTQADYTIQRSYRLSLNLGGDGFLVRRRSTALYGLSGAAARADAQYRITRRSTIGVGYTFTHYGYHGIYSSSDLHSLVGTYGIRLTRNLEVSAYGGILRAETTYLQNVPIDPAIAAVIGRAFGSVITHRIDYIPNISARISRRFPQGVAYFSGGRSMSPGNGLFLTSAMTTMLAGYTYSGLRFWSLTSQAQYFRADSIANFVGGYGSTGGTLSASRKIFPSLHAVVSFSGRKYLSGSFSGYNRLIYSASLGLSYSPGDIPLRLW